MTSVEAWLQELGLGQYAKVFAENDIDFDVLPDLNDQDLQQLGVSLGHRKKLARAIRALGEAEAPPRVSDPAEQPQPRLPHEAERRQLTVMFCDLVGSTELSTKLDPEDLRELMYAYQERCTSIIVRFDGHVGNYVGDGILAYFGYPRAHEDDAQRAVRAGLEIPEAVAALGAERGIELAVRVGIQTGVVIAGDIGTGEFRDEMAIVGETPNVAARLQALAEPGTVLIGSGTQHLVDGLFVLDELGPTPVKGVAAPMPVYRVREPSDTPTRFEASASRGLTTLVGREEEIGLLMSRWRRTTEGEGQLVLLSGEAGIGKSRIVQTLRESIKNDRHTVIRQFCSPFYTNSAFRPVLDHLERAAGFHRSDPPEMKLAKLEALLGQATEAPAEAAAALARLMSIPTGDRYPPLDLTPQQLKARAFEVLVAQITGLAGRAPVLMVVEDVHWMDPSSIELFHRLVDRVPRLPVMIIMTYRPGFTPPWTGQPNVTSLSLTGLGQRQATEMVERVTGGKPLPPEVVDVIVERTDGVPLFVEELTKAILETGQLEDVGDRYELTGPLPSLAIPASLHDSLMARLDRLAPIKELAQLAATLGRNFSQELLEAVSSLKDPHLSRALGQLIEAELLYRRGAPPSVVYDFKHALVQDVAYGSLLRSKRQQLHMRIATVLESQFPETAVVTPELLGHHFRQAGMPERAIPFAMRAGDLAVQRYAYTEARTRYRDALDMARTLPSGTDAARAQIDASLKLASVAANRGQFERDLENLAEAERLAGAAEDQHALCQIRYWIGRLNYVLGHFDAGVSHASDALRIADGLGADDTVTADPVNLLARLHCLRGEPREAIAHARRNVKQMARLDKRIEEAAVSGVLAFAHGMHGDFEEAFAAAAHGVALARQVDHLPTLAACWHFLAVVKGWHGDLEDAVPAFDEALLAADQAGDVFRRYLVQGWRGEAYLLADETRLAEADLRECLALGDRIGTTFHRGAFEAFLAKILLLHGDVSGAEATSERALAVATKTGQAWSRSIALRMRAEVLLGGAVPGPVEAEDLVREAIAIQEARSCRFDAAWSRVTLARVLLAQGRRIDAEVAAEAAAMSFEAMTMANRVPALVAP